MNYIYHLVPTNMEGSTLYPLNQLKDINLELYSQYVAKYQGREELLEKKLLPLDCLWNDVLFFMTIDPYKFKEVHKQYGYGKVTRKFFKIPANALDPAKATIYLGKVNGRVQLESFREYDPDNLAEYSEIGQRQLDYFAEVLSRPGQQFYYYNYSPHLLYKGTLDVKDFEIITV